MARLETRTGFSRSPAQRANFTAMAVNYGHGVMRAAQRSAERIESTATLLAHSQFGADSEYAGRFDVVPGPIVSIDGQKRGSWRVVNHDEIASLVELGPRNPGPRPQGGSAGEAQHILYRAGLAHSGTSHRPG